MRHISVISIVLFLTTASHADVTIDFVTVGNPGNAADNTGYGSVADLYQIGKYEITAAQYTEFLNAVAATDTHGLYSQEMWSSNYGCKIQRGGSPGSHTYAVSADQANRPVNFVSFWDAARFVNWLHNGQGNGDTESGAYMNIGNQDTLARQPGAKYWIPSEHEWYKAAYHKNDGVTGNYWDFPTSSDDVPSNDLEALDPGNNANFSQSGYTIGSPYYRTEVGAFSNSDSPYGTFDQGGNVSEWNETAVTALTRGERGGSFLNAWDALWVGDRPSYYGPADEVQHLGFRVATVPEPGTITLFLCSALTGLLCWWRKRRQ